MSLELIHLQERLGPLFCEDRGGETCTEVRSTDVVKLFEVLRAVLRRIVTTKLKTGRSSRGGEEAPSFNINCAHRLLSSQTSFKLWRNDHTITSSSLLADYKIWANISALRKMPLHPQGGIRTRPHPSK
jgi:hypothetical protein